MAIRGLCVGCVHAREDGVCRRLDLVITKDVRQECRGRGLKTVGKVKMDSFIGLRDVGFSQLPRVTRWF